MTATLIPMPTPLGSAILAVSGHVMQPGYSKDGNPDALHMASDFNVSPSGLHINLRNGSMEISTFRDCVKFVHDPAEIFTWLPNEDIKTYSFERGARFSFS